ncbi:WD40 repeat domain-containing protein [Parvularcula sp. LCG005]|uniref:WD40 repeat domain-containing protein n=1 Tax=Parvularcula sp. LCG005 TaxID=3078805 RepID=UPI002941EC06|nr:WD40 repeat domain-containing protein [Parvularcula sp. LCG005]WOI54400.1 WD40 repeat domain-containing protein [Parvularcula sp. LCG005]
MMGSVLTIGLAAVMLMTPPVYHVPVTLDTAVAEPLHTLSMQRVGLPDAVNSLAVIPGTAKAAVALNREVLIVDTDRLALINRVEACDFCTMTNIHVSDDGQTIDLTGNKKKEGRRYALGSLEPVSTLPPTDPRAVISPDGRYRLHNVDRQAQLTSGDGTVLWDSGLPDPKGMAFSSGSTLMVIAYDDDAAGKKAGAARLLTVEGRETLAEIKFERATFTFAAFAPDGDTLALGAYTGRIILWDVPGQRLIAHFQAGDGLRSMVISPDGQYIAVGGGRKGDGYAGLWRLSDGQPIARQHFGDRVAGLDFDGRGAKLIAGSWANELAVIDLSPLYEGN